MSDIAAHLVEDSSNVLVGRCTINRGREREKVSFDDDDDDS